MRVCVAACVGLISLAAASAAQAAKPADTVLRNGYVYTVDDEDSVAEAVAVRNGGIVYVGSDRGARRFTGPGTRVVNLKGRMVMPGIQDGHIHDVTRSDQKTCDLEAAPLTVPELQARLRACLDDPALGGPNDWLQVTNLYMQFLKPAGTAPHKSMLDALGTQRPIVVTAAVTGHTTLVNSKALQLAGITASTPDPEGGRIDHDPNGEPSGLLQDTAADPVFALIPPPPPVTAARELQLARQRMRDFNREGITSFMQPLADPALVKRFHLLSRAGKLTARAHFAIGSDLTEYKTRATRAKLYARVAKLRRQVERTERLPRSVTAWRPGHQRGKRLVARPGVSVDAVKIFLDGIAQFPGQTAAMLKPYLGANGQPRTDPAASGELYVDGSTLDPTVIGLERRGFQAHIHAIGDRAVRTALDAFAAARKANGNRHSHPTIAHAEVVSPADYKRFGRYDVTASMGLQWAKPAPDSTDAVKPYLSGDRFDLYEPTAPITRAGGRVSLGSDCCLDPFDEWFDLEVAILREADWGAEFPQFAGKLNALPGLTLKQGIRAVTINAAYQMHQEKVTGSLEKGKLADLVVLDQNITKVPRDDISDTDVLMTMVGGKRVWVDPSF
ncbi:MAG TPA: amidohydrolase [Solirubrobacteraceae bacterium]|nr:amidohydrolase [Solirubrobacteraceae bacterium]